MAMTERTPPRRPSDELQNLKNAYEKTRQVLDKQGEEWSAAGSTCCPDCMFGRERANMIDKQYRRVERMSQLVRRKIPIGPLPPWLLDLQWYHR